MEDEIQISQWRISLELNNSGTPTRKLIFKPKKPLYIKKKLHTNISSQKTTIQSTEK